MCNEINTLFGLNVSVEFNPILKKVYSDFMNPPEQNVSRETNDPDGNNDPDDPDDTNDGNNEPKDGDE
jgi:hypothetical protein